MRLPNGRTIQYKYDADGNRTQVTDNGVTTKYTTNNLNQYVTVGNVTYGYDADGNMISKRDSSGLTTYTYDEQNRLTKVTGPDGTWTYEYDVFGNCRATTFNGQRTNYLLDPFGMGDVIGAYNGAGGLVAHYTYGLGLTSRTDAAGVTDFYDFDALGSMVGLTGATGAYVNHYSYLPFGESLSSAETVANPFDYVGRWGVQTQGNGLDFMRARFYTAPLGVFTGADPLGHPGESFYTYALNNPVQRVDPLGFQSSGLDQYFHDNCSQTIDYGQLLNEWNGPGYGRAGRRAGTVTEREPRARPDGLRGCPRLRRGVSSCCFDTGRSGDWCAAQPDGYPRGRSARARAGAGASALSRRVRRSPGGRGGSGLPGMGRSPGPCGTVDR